MNLITKKISVSIITTILFIANTIFISCFYTENASAGDITHSEYTSTLTVGVGNTRSPSSNSPPIAKINGPYYTLANRNIVFNGSTSYDPDGTIVNYNWDFGDNNSGNGVNPTHIYNKAGKYTVTLTITDDSNNTADGTTQVTIIRGESAHQIYFNFLQRIVDSFPRLAHLFSSVLNQNKGGKG